MYIYSRLASSWHFSESGHFPFLPPVYIMGGGGDTKKSLEEVKAELLTQLTNNARDLLKKVTRRPPS